MYFNVTLKIKRELSERVFREAPEDNTLSLCWKGKRPFKSIRDIRKYFKTISLDFTSAGITKTFEFPPEAYLIISVCLT